MGYNADLMGSNFRIPADKLEAACQALKDLNKRDDLKSGWAYGTLPDGTYGRLESYFSWMPADYDQTMHTAREIFEELGFDVEEELNGDLLLTGYSSKSGDEDKFLEAAAPFVQAESFLYWEGEDGDRWQHYFDGKTMQTLVGHTVYGEPEAPQLDSAQLRDIVLPALNRDSMDAEHEALSKIADLLGIQYDDSTEQYALTK